MKKNDLTHFNNIVKQVKLARKSSIKVGLAQDVGHYQDGTSVLEIGTKHEFGLGVARRSFLRVPLEKEKAKMNNALKSGFKNILNGGSATINLNKVGFVGQNISKNAFQNQGFGVWKDISQTTKDNKKSSKILFDTGRLVQSITFWIDKK